MANVTPNTLIVGFAHLAAAAPAPAEGIFIPLSALPGLSTVEADGATGDARKVVYEICRAVNTSISGMDAASRPTRMTVSRSTPTGVNATTIRQSYTLSFDLEVTNADVVAE